MGKLEDMLQKAIGPIKIDLGESFSKFLTDEADFEGTPILTEADPFGGDAGDTSGDTGGDAGGDTGGTDPFAADATGGTDPFGGDVGGAGGAGGGAGGASGGTGGTSSETDDSQNAEDDKEDESPVNDGSHEDDPEFLQGKADPNDVTTNSTPAAKVVYDVEKIMQAVVSVTQTLKEEQLVEIEKVKTDIELIFNGKLLNPEDLEFKNIKNAIFLIKKIGAKIDVKARAYLNRKMKEPLIKKRDEIKQDIATMKGDLDNTRDMLTALDVN